MINILRNNWVRIKVGDVCEVGRGSSPRPISDPRYFEGGTIPWIKIADATKSGKYLYETREKVNEYGASFSRIMPAGTLIVAASGTLGYTQFLGVPGCVHDGWLYLHSFKEIDKNFLYYLFHWRQQHFYNMAYGAAIQNINTTILREMEIDVPPLRVQRKIAAILSNYDDLIENNSRRMKILEETARLIYEEWFVKFRFPGHERVKIIESELGMTPRGWQVVPFTEIADVLSGGTPKTTIPEYWNGSIPFFTPKDSPDDFYVFETEKSITPMGLENCSSRLYQPNTIFITARGTVGNIALAGRDMAMNQSCYALSARDGISQFFLFLATINCIDYLKTNTGGATFATIVVDTFRRMKTLKPPTELTNKLHVVLEPMFGQIHNLVQQVQNLRQTRDLLLPRLISGEIDVEKLDIKLPAENGAAAVASL